ncbi:MAG: FHA domain-containing protein [Paracoccaceae bacterium]
MELDIATYRSFAETRWRDLKDLVLPRSAHEIVVHVEVMNGLHHGSAAELKADALVIGPDSSNDIMLVDDEVLGSTLHVTCRRSLLGPLLSLRTSREDVTLNGKPIADDSSTVTERLPCEIGINGIYIRFAPVEAPSSQTPDIKEQIALGVLIAMGLTALGGQTYLSHQPETPDIVMPVSQANVSLASDPAPANVDIPQNAQAMINQAGLDSYLTVSAPSAGMIRISGQVPPEQMRTWRALRQDLDQSAGGAVILADVSETAALTDLPPIAAVTLGSTPKVVFANKSFAHTGDRVAGDWIVEEITHDMLRLRRGTETINVTF